MRKLPNKKRFFGYGGAGFEATDSLRIAASWVSLEMVRCLIELGAGGKYGRGLRGPYWDTCHDGCTGLRVTAKGCLSDEVKLLMAHGTDPQVQDLSGVSVIDVARDAGHEDTLHRLDMVEDAQGWNRIC